MPERVNRRDLILQTAAELFEKQGYRATSTRQIAEAVGCTEAALYYHFKAGKHALLQAVIEAHMPEVQPVIDHCRRAASLKEAMVRFNTMLAKRAARMRWMLTALPHLDKTARAAFTRRFLTLRDGLVEVFTQYIDDARLAAHLAWLIVCVGIGYEQLFWDPAFSAEVDVDPQDLIQALIEVMA